MLAAKGSNLQIVTYLVDKAGADVNAENKKHENALQIASDMNQQEIVKYLKNKTTNKNGLDKVKYVEKLK